MPMSYEQFVALVVKMRAAQTHYFRCKNNLPECKELERQVDAEARAQKAGPSLFPDEATAG